ncbi:MAG: DUF4292 domain-containing protein [Prevotella sp.]|nr:DUF4292 domain-containing protein [Prevotella sp.]
MKRSIISASVLCAMCAVLMTSCGAVSQFSNSGTRNTSTTQQGSTTKTTASTATVAAAKGIDYVRKVNDNAVYTKNITSKIDVTINSSGKDISVSGKLNMRRNEVIRITLTPFGLMEVGRLEFTPDYVLLINRLDKEYVKATYNDVDFLKANGLDFYSLQALFWNELFQPAKKELTDTDLAIFNADMAQQGSRHITLTASKLSMDWTTDAAKALITEALITYAKGTTQASTVKMEYGDFMPMGSKRFPTKEKVTFASKSMSTGKISLELLLNKINNDANWEPRTTVSDKFRQITPQQFFTKLGNM